jgi:hypothetical protein
VHAALKGTHIVWIPKRHSMAPSLGELLHCRIALGWGTHLAAGPGNTFELFGGCAASSCSSMRRMTKNHCCCYD